MKRNGGSASPTAASTVIFVRGIATLVKGKAVFVLSE
jgi:hypothetical protein